jgi:hypothetical protein
MLIIRLSYCHLMTYFMWLSFKYHLPAASTGHVILEVKDIGKGKIHPSRATKIQRQSRFVALLYFILTQDKCVLAKPHPGHITNGTDMVSFL